MSGEERTPYQRLLKVCENMKQELGVTAQVDYWCCATCGHANMALANERNYIFAHQQSMDDAFGPEVINSGAEPEALLAGLVFHHRLESRELKEAVIREFNKEHFLVEWGSNMSMDDSVSFVVHN